MINLPSSQGSLYRNAIDFGVVDFDETLLSDGGQEIFIEGTLGGSSVHSEITAFELLHRCELAFLVKTETEIEYTDLGGKKTDMLVEINREDVGVSVTRAFHWPEGEPYTADEADSLLSDKLSDIQLSAENAAESNDWDYSILHVIAYDAQHADMIVDAHTKLAGPLTDAAIVIVTVTDGIDDFVY